jgi:hypothetical protein
MESPKRARSRKRLTQPRGVLHTTAPVPDPTAPDGPGNSENAPGRLIKVKLPPGQAKK